MSEYYATDKQKAYLATLCNRVYIKRLDMGKWAGRDYRQAIRSDYLTSKDASEWIKHLKEVLL